MATTLPATAAAPSTNRPAPTQHKRRRRLSAVGRPNPWVYVFLAVVLLGSVFPIYWSLLIGSGDSSTLNDPNKSWWPGGNFLSNAAKVIDNDSINFWKSILNSIIVSTVVAASTVFFSTLAGYAFAKLRFRAKKGLLVFVIATTAVPTQLGVVPLFIAMSDFGWTGTLGAVIVPALVSAFGVFWMTQYIGQALPDELIEAGRIDGTNMFQTFWYIALPTTRPAAAMLALFTFITTWTNFFWPFIVLNSDNPTLPVSLATLQGSYFIDYSVVLAGALLATLPLVFLFIVAGRQLVAGIMQGAVKG
ncbi:MAG: carbohydrate ABC transporter permease [Lacisediminihabitans sp.]